MVSNTSSLRSDWNEFVGTAVDWGASLGLPTSVAARRARQGPIPGDPDTLAEMAEHFRALGQAFERSGRGFRAIDTGGWQGEAAEAARAYLEQSPKKFFAAADAFTEAGDAVSRYERVLRRAQQRAEAAQRELAEATQRAQHAAEEHNRRVEQARQEGGPPPPPFEDPTAEQREAARDTIERARAEVNEAAHDAADTITRACQAAPDKPGWLARTRQSMVDGVQQAGRVLGSVAEGIGSGLSDMAKGLWTFSPTHPWNQTHPAAYAARMYNTAEAIVTRPYQTIKTGIGIDTWKNDPGKATGEMIPGLVSSAVGGGGVAAKAASAASRIAKTARGLDNVPTGGARVPGSAPHGSNGPGQAPSRPSQGPTTPSGTQSQPPRHTPEPAPPPWARAEGELAPPNPTPRTPHPTPEPNQPFGPGSQPQQPFGPGSQPDTPFGPGSQPQQPFGPGSQPSRPPELGDSAPPGPRDSTVEQPRDPLGPAVKEPPEPHQQRPDIPSTPDKPGSRDLSGEHPGRDFEEALREVTEHGDPIRFNEKQWDFEPGTEKLPEGLDRNPDDFPEADRRFVFNKLDPAETPLYRTIPGGNLEELFERGLHARHPDAEANLDTLNAHVGGAGTPTPFISTTDSLGHAISRGFDEGDVILDIRKPDSVVDTDATFRDLEGDRSISHGEREKLILRQLPPEQIRGAWKIVDGQPRWFANPRFDASLMKGSGS